jgi:hypothetical protein
VQITVPFEENETGPSAVPGSPAKVRFALPPGGIVAEEAPSTEIVKLVWPLIVRDTEFDEANVNSFPLAPMS